MISEFGGATWLWLLSKKPFLANVDPCPDIMRASTGQVLMLSDRFERSACFGKICPSSEFPGWVGASPYVQSGSPIHFSQFKQGPCLVDNVYCLGASLYSQVVENAWCNGLASFSFILSLLLPLDDKWRQGKCHLKFSHLTVFLLQIVTTFWKHRDDKFWFP